MMPRRAFIDGPGARVAAFLVFAACAAALAYIHREDLWPAPSAPAAPENVALAQCLAERIGAVERMRADGVITEAQHEAFRGRAEAYCQGQFGR